MSHTVYTFNSYHLGDNLIFLHLLRSLAKQSVSRPFVHFCNGCDIPQLQEAVADIPNILLLPFEDPLWRERERSAVCTWKNSDQHWELSPVRWDWSAHTLRHHAWIADKLGFESPLKCREALFFDYPKLLDGPLTDYGTDFLIINSEPSSGQFAPMAQHGSGYLDGLIWALVKAGHRVVITKPLVHEPDEEISGELYILGGERHFTISQIGNLSLRCKNIIGVATGPLWPCINVHNNHNHEGRRFIALLNNGEALNMPHWEQCGSVEEVMRIAGEGGWV
jgi:hypothetical protein